MTQQSTRHWTVLDQQAGIWVREYEFARGGQANCLVARMPEGELLVLSPATGLSDAGFAALAELGPVGAVVATNGFHHLGVPEWRKRFPKARFFTPELSAKRIAKKNPEAGPFEPLAALAPLLGDALEVHEASPSKCGETWAYIKTGRGYVWFVSDILANMPALPSSLVPKLLFKLSKSAPGYRVFHLALQFMVKDKKAVLRTLLGDLDKYPPVMVVPAHGPPVTKGDVAGTTRLVLQGAL